MTLPTIFDTGVRLAPDLTRVITRIFVPGREDSGPGNSRATPVVERILALDEATVETTLASIDERFGSRHVDLHNTFLAHAELVHSRVADGVVLSTARQLVLGASFTHEYSIEGAALCNPSAVLFPGQDDSGDAEFVISVRCIGEGHRSSIGFRAGTVSSEGKVVMHEPSPFCRTTTPQPGVHHRSVFHARLEERGDNHENAAAVLDSLPPTFDDAQLEERITSLVADRVTRRHTTQTVANLREIARSSYSLTFPASTDISERVLWPHAPSESHGMEDARFVHFTSDSGERSYLATYTAYDGQNIAQHLLTTDDFVSFTCTPMAGSAAIGKGLAIFPRKVRGRYVALSRSDRETNSVAFSADLRYWPTSTTIQVPTQPWEILQLGNCGSPVETDRGWLVLTHGVGPMRTYAMSVILLDLDDPTKVVARSTEPLLTPTRATQNGYVPNVVYSCGAFAHNGTLVIPYGVADQSIAIATVNIEDLLDTLT
jgi:predicted GH43/DUF377 family glycosyl hydrolase